MAEIEYVVLSDEVRMELEKYPEFVLSRDIGQYSVYELTTNENRYVTPLAYEPVLYETDNWKELSYRWFKHSDRYQVHLAFTKKADEDDLTRFGSVRTGDEIGDLPKTPITGSCDVSEEIKEEEISITTTCLNRPLLVKISYHPNWQVKGADKVYLVSPSFMSVYPETEQVTLRFARTRVEYTGISLTIIALVIMTVNIPMLRRHWIKSFEGGITTAGNLVIGRLSRMAVYRKLTDVVGRHRVMMLIATVCSVSLIMVLFIFQSKRVDPNRLFTSGLGSLNDRQYSEAREAFGMIMTQYPITSVAQNANYHFAITYFKEENYEKTIDSFERLIAEYPRIHWVPEAYYHIGLSHIRLEETEAAKLTFELIVDRFPASIWSQYAHDRLLEMDEQ